MTLNHFLTEQELKPIEVLYDKFMRGEVMTIEKHKKDFCDMSQVRHGVFSLEVYASQYVVFARFQCDFYGAMCPVQAQYVVSLSVFK
jgi:hypothetical protein